MCTIALSQRNVQTLSLRHGVMLSMNSQSCTCIYFTFLKEGIALWLPKKHVHQYGKVVYNNLHASTEIRHQADKHATKLIDLAQIQTDVCRIRDINTQSIQHKYFLSFFTS